MTNEEYKNLKRFNQDDHHFKNTLFFEENDIFEIFNMENRILYMKIKDNLKNLFFDLKECTPDGEPVRCPYTKNSIKLSEILERIGENDWRLFKKAHISKTNK